MKIVSHIITYNELRVYNEVLYLKTNKTLSPLCPLQLVYYRLLHAAFALGVPPNAVKYNLPLESGCSCKMFLAGEVSL